MAQNLSNFDAVLKEFYEGPIRDQLNSEIFLLRQFAKEDGAYVGQRVVFPVNTGRNEGVGARADGGTLPTAQQQRYTESQITAKYNYGRIEVTGPVIKASQNDRGAFARAVGKEIELMVRDLKNDINRQLYGVGTGQLALVNGTVTATTTMTVDTPSARFIKANMLLDVAAGTSFATGITVSSVNTSTNVVTLASAISADDNAGVFRTGSRNNEMMGLRGIVDDGTLVNVLQNINRTTFPIWRARTLTNPAGAGTNRALTLDLMQQAIDTAAEQGNGEIDCIISHYSVRREYLNLLTADKRYVSQDLDGGYRTLEYNDVPFFFDKDADFNRIFFLDKSSLKIYRLSDFFWADEDGSILSRVANTDAFEAFLKYYAEFASDQPNKNVRLDDITATVIALT